MSREATQEYVIRMRVRYTGMKTKRAKGKALDEFCATTELSRKHAIKVLRSQNVPYRRSGRPRKYGQGVGEALKRIYLEADQPCSRLMVPIMADYVRSYEKAYGNFPAKVRQGLLSISAATIDRLLRADRVNFPRRRRSPTGVSAVKREVPIRAGEWDVSEPGWLEGDTVAHSGGNMEGSFVWSLTATDIQTQWTEVRAMWNRGATATHDRIRQIEQALPFPVKGFDSDNGPEFMNWHLYRYFKGRSPAVSFTRSRAYQKNDNAHVEQKNGTHVRGLLGHARIEDFECVEPLNEVMGLWSLWKNLYRPVMKLISRTQEGHRSRKKYDEPQTPAHRVLACPGVEESEKKRIRMLYKSTDCFELKRRIDVALKDVFTQIARRAEIASGGEAGTSALRAAPAGTVPASPPDACRPLTGHAWPLSATSKTKPRKVS